MNRFLKIFVLFITTLLFANCRDLEKKAPEKGAIARVNNVYLYQEDIADLINSKISKEDSTLIVSNYINNWITEQVLLGRARLNLPIETQRRFKKLVKDYQEKLFIKAYKDALVGKNLDSTISEHKIKEFYANNKKIFNLNENLIKLRYIHVNDSLPDFDEVKERFKRFEEEDIKKLLDQALQFHSYSFNDSVWVSEIKVLKQIKPLNSENNKSLLKKSNFMQLQDSLGVYLIFVNDVLLRKDQAPLNYVKPTIEQILLHKRKLKLARKLEKGITEDAFKNEQIEIYH